MDTLTAFDLAVTRGLPPPKSFVEIGKNRVRPFSL